MIIDSHCHIDFEDFDSDRDQVIHNANRAGVEKIIVPGITARNWQRQHDICQQYTGLYAAFGLHPYFLEQHQQQHIDALKQWIEQHDTIGIGECGLDFFLPELDKDTQQFYFYAQLELALEKQLPVVIHARKATEQVIQAIKQRPGLRGMIHSYSGSYEQATQLIDLGFFISLGASITYDNATRIQKIASQLPLEHLLVETDAPDQAGGVHRGKRNEPGFIVEVVEGLACIKGLSRENIIQQTSLNAMTLFGLD
ncbi:MAG: TatD family hydrolase [Gammaproteobacteria bacterium]|nr:TatD family hydrolase [Gammaproteobacteria bacterium]